MATIILALIIFGSASYVIYARLTSGKNCGDCHSGCCEVKKQEKK